MMKLSKKMRSLGNSIFTMLFLLPVLASAQPGDSVAFNKKRFKTLAVTSSIGYGASLIGLHQLWYKNTERQPFQFFNDNKEWKQVDKLGHFYSSFYFSYGTSKALQWCGVKDRRANFAGALTGFLILLPIEVMDGFSERYGASSGDLLANLGGATAFWAQTAIWNEVRIQPKFSFHRTRFAKQRPEVLGENLISEIIKDYNGQTYWLSFDMDKFVSFPKWLNLAAGYGADNMIFAENHANEQVALRPFRQYYFSIDFDLTAFKTRSKFVNTTLFVLNMIKVPAPALSFSKSGATFHFLYF